jgi:hypothetical protein
LVGTGRNNFILEWNDNRQEDIDFNIDDAGSENKGLPETGKEPDLFSEN